MAQAQVPVYQPAKEPPTQVQPSPTMHPASSSYGYQPSTGYHPSTGYQPPPVAGIDPNNTLQTDQQSVQFNLNYFKTPMGIISVFATVHAFVAIIVMVVRGHYWPYSNLIGAYGFYIFVAVMCFLISAGTILIGVTQFVKHHPTLPWPVIMVVTFAIMAFFTLLASSLVAARSLYARDGACAVIGFVLFQVYIASLCLNLQEATQYLNRYQQSRNARRPAHIHVETPPMGSPPSYIESCPPSSLSNPNLNNPTYG
ncbi:hypothetical protein HOLleu_32652 [Holothuria leucospilota]|uniref:MARVEL domain-containing protein n=1 Tax=Holothuria leucospilota TaxID=206669 RepID=A0A9Q1BJ16_HOLLE|nr:hypothetical protein HOLleu_32652 [Holothuria leucospilota]